MMVIASLLSLIANQNWQLVNENGEEVENETNLNTTVYVDPNDGLNLNVTDPFSTITFGMLILSLLTTSLAAFFSASNHHLSCPIRLLAAAENLNKFIFALCYFLAQICDQPWVSVSCTDTISNTFSTIYSIADEYNLCDIAQYCQCLISIR
ncbi:unnamed protein product, partial [Mesorhabditis belari]|uniref:Uncharacterized protein n=1 Tax=Mesorhabditis belari TaxID=2138241 RepID=A0AAF3F8J2_9BILA